MAVHTQRLAVGNTGAAGSVQTIYECPTGVTAIVKDIRIENGNTAGNQVVLFTHSGAADVAVVRQTLSQFDIHGAECWVVLLPAEQLRIVAVSGQMTYRVSGTELDGLAP